MVGIARTGNDDHAPLQVPSEDYLRYRLVVTDCDFGQYRIAQKLLLMSSTTKRIPCLDNNSEVMKMLHHFRVLIIRVNFVLDQYRFDVHFRQKFADFLDIVARYADWANLACRHIFFDRFVRFHIVRTGMVQQHKVYISDVKFAQTFLDGSFRVGILVGIELGRHENILARHTRFSDALSHFLFVAIDGCCIEFAETGGNGCFHRIDAGWHFVTAAQFDRRGIAVRPFREVEYARIRIVVEIQIHAFNPFFNCFFRFASAEPPSLLPFGSGS